MEAQSTTPVATAALKCLFNDDIIPQILEKSPRQMRPEAVNQALLRIALSELRSLVPLIRLLPSTKLVEGSYVLGGELVASEWSRFDHYARRVQSLTLIQGQARNANIVDPALYLRIAEEHPEPLLPNLRILLCFPLVTEAVLFLGPSLRSIVLHSSDTRMACTFLASIHSKAPKVEKLKITLQGAFTSSIYSCIAKLDKLLSLGLCWRNSPLSEYAILDAALAGFPLKNYSIDASGEWENDLRKHPLSLGFSTLGSVSVDGGHKFIASAVERVKSTQISTITIFHSGASPTAVDWNPLLGLVFHRWWSSLEVLMVDLNQSSRAVNLNTLFGALDRCNHLREFGVYNYWPIRIADRDIEIFAQKCPRLIRVHLTAGRQLDAVAPSVSCLAYLANHCRGLAAIDISLNTIVALPFEIPHAFRGSTALRILQIHGMLSSSANNSGEMRAVARFLDLLFPDIEYVQNVPIPDPAWKAVEAQVKKLQVARVERELGR
ncbi:hypothetical protein B0H16DRAFT_1715858 [Mycena metata]|uniref:Uncharacterized protein n=1 Tax=Mycena metata TaxID=1033252 RepID=A0AAD7JPW5_9AGAR|nr:hypothetical protein B0H16DRAFT_1715858 [Mycena metata]